MICPDCENDVWGDVCTSCGWKPKPTPTEKPRHQFDPSKGPYLSRDECGLDFLYAVGRCASLRQIRKHIELSRDRLQWPGRQTHPERRRWQHELADDLKTEKEVIQEVVTALHKLNTSGHAFIVDRYRDVIAPTQGPTLPC